MSEVGEPIVNKTGSAIVAIVILVFSMSTIAWLIFEGKADNGLHATALSWSYTMLGIVMAALGLAPFIAQIMPLIRKPEGK
jgi:hypothetical protein